MRDAVVWLQLQTVSAKDTRHYRHLELIRWQGHVRVSVRRFFINNQSQLYPTRDGVQYNAKQLGVLKRMFLLIRNDFAMAARTAQQMSEQEQDTMALILAWEQNDTEGSQQPQEEEAADEVDSPATSPRTVAVASQGRRAERSQEPTPSTSMAKVAAAPSADILLAVIPKLKRKNAMTRKTINVPRSRADDHRHYACEGHIAPLRKPVMHQKNPQLALRLTATQKP